jgi:uncharacterized protein YggE
VEQLLFLCNAAKSVILQSNQNNPFMKKVLLTFTIIISSVLVFAQAENQPKGRTIEVTGSAELEITPDEVYLNVTLREYMKDKNKVYLTDIDKEFQKVLANTKIDLKDVSVEGASGYYNYEYWRNHTTKTDFLASKTYSINLSNLEKYNELMQKMDNKGIENAYLQRTDHSKIEEYRQQVKINALKAAKEKARLMLESIGEQLGEVQYIKEINQGYYQPVMYKGMANMAMDSESAGGNAPVEMQKIKLRYEVEVHFKIK